MIINNLCYVGVYCEFVGSMSVHTTLCISDVCDLFVWLSDSAVHAGTCLWCIFV